MWRSMPKQELERQYSPSQWSQRLSPDEVVKEHIKVITQGSEQVKSTVSCQLGVSYGDSDEQKLDIFGAEHLPGDAPVLVFIHGGYWQILSIAQSCYMAAPLVDAGAVFVSVGYDLAPKVTMPEIVDQVRSALQLIFQMAKSRGSRGVYLCGHSAGGHLAAMMLTTAWTHVSPTSFITGAVLVSGVFDLRPIVETRVNDPICMTTQLSWEQSPLNHTGAIATHFRGSQILVVVGEHDSPEFHRQSQEFTKKLTDAGMSVSFRQIDDTDHFDVMEKLQDPGYELTQMILRMMGLK